MRVVKIVRLSLLASIVLCGVLGEYIAQAPAHPPGVMIFYAVTVLAIVVVVTIALVRRLILRHAEAAVSSQPGNLSALNRWRAGYVAIYALCESVGLYGLVLRFLGFTLSQVAPFYVAGVALMLFFSPRAPSRELS